MTKQKTTVPSLLSMKHTGRKISVVTAYDATYGRLVDASGVDMVLVGDSLGMVVQGHDSTIPVTLNDVIYHTRAVARGVSKAHICADMPFMTNKVSPEKSLEAAGRLVQEGFAESVKLEGGAEMAPTIARIVAAGIPVVGHVGLTPQSVHAMGGFRTQGKNRADREQILADAQAVADAGAFCIVLEGIPSDLAAEITTAIKMPTIGIGAGPHCDGQVLVIYDLLGMNAAFNPKFLKKYANLDETITTAVRNYCDDVRSGAFPAAQHSGSAKE